MTDGDAGMRGLMEVAFAQGEPALPDVDDVLAEIEVLGGRIRHRQRVRTGVAAAVLCVAAFGMVAGIAEISRSTSSTSVVVPAGGNPSSTDQVSPNPTSADTGS